MLQQQNKIYALKIYFMEGNVSQKCLMIIKEFSKGIKKWEKRVEKPTNTHNNNWQGEITHHNLLLTHSEINLKIPLYF